TLLLRTFLVLALAGCTMSTGMIGAGPNTWTITERASPILGGTDTAQRTAVEKANAQCRSQGREMLPVDMHSVRGITTESETGYSVTFRCLLPSDPEFRR